MDLYLEDDCLARKILCVIVFRECYIHIYLIAGLFADQLLFKARDETAGSNLKRMLLAFSAFKRSAVQKAFKIDDCGIAVFDDAVLIRDGTAVAVPLVLDRLVYFCVGHRRIHFGHRNAFVLAELYVRTLCRFCRIDKRLSFFNLYDLNGWAGNNLLSALIQ